MAAPPLDPAQMGAAAYIKAMLQEWGIAELYDDAVRLIREGLDGDAITLQLQETQSFKTRFSANEDRRRKGLPALSPGEYIATERQYRQVLRQYGLPEGFYDSNDDVKNFLRNDVSPAELAQRAQAAQKVWLSGNADYRSTWRDFYGLTDGAAIAAMLDPKTAMPIIDQQVAAAQIGAAAKRQGLGVDRRRAEELGALGVDEQAALTGYGQIAATAGTDQGIAKRFGEDFTLAEQEDDRLLGLASARRKRQRLYGAEQGLFAERGGSAEGALSREAAGQY